jgi:periplasmic divalent cation tolerance protein
MRLPRTDNSVLTMTREENSETMNSPNSRNPMNLIVVLITASSEEEAHKIARLLVKEKKAACVNVVPGADSLFRWKGKIDSARETLLLVKTRAPLLPDIISLVKEVHSYEVPEVIALPIIDGSEDYLRWLDSACQ